MTPNDKRGKSKSNNAIQPSELKLIYDHISSFPVKQSHYSGKEFYYLSSDLTVKKMYECF